MYDTQYNRKIANEIDHINKNFVKHNKNLEGAGFMNYLPLLLAGMGQAQTGQQEYVKAKGGSKKQMKCSHCEGTGISGSGVSGSGVSDSGVSGSGVSGSGVSGSGVSGSGFKMSIGFGKKRGRKPKQAPTEEPPKDLDGGFGISFGFGKKRGRKPKQAPAPQQKDLDGGFGISFGFGKDGKKKKRGNPNINKRAEIVKQVMKEQGLGMIQASQYVKAHNLY